MSELALTSYVMVWPTVAAIVLVVLCAGFIRDVHCAKKNGESVI